MEGSYGQGDISFNMNGERCYSFKPASSSVRFFALDSNYMDDKQLTWLDKELLASAEGHRVLHRWQLGEAARGQGRNHR